MSSDTARAPAKNGAHLMVQALEAEGVDVLFGYPGGAIMPFYDALVGSKLRHILTRHEQGAALAANGFARASGRVGVCVATSGPGASNLVTGIADAFLDSVPMVVLTGQVPTTLMGTDAFQELDVYGMTLPIVKHSFLLRRIEDLPHVVHEAFRIARSGRPGPVLIDFPKDVQIAAATHMSLLEPAPADTLPSPPAAGLAEAIAAIASAERPVVYSGQGITLAEAVEPFRQFVEAAKLPTVTTLRGLGNLTPEHPYLIGMLGMHGTRAANMAVQNCDLLIVVGARFDDRATGKLAEFAPSARVIHLDADIAEISKLRQADIPLYGDLHETLSGLASARSNCAEWHRRCMQMKASSAPRYDAPGKGVYAPALLKRMSEIAPPDTIVACDVGQHQMWVAQHWKFHHPRNHLTSGALGTMGFGLPAAIGAQFSCPDRPVVLVSGDGSIMMNIQELATVARCKLPIKMILLDNSTLGMVRQWQELFFDRNYSEIDLSDNPDFAALCRVFRIPAIKLERREDTEAALRELLATPGPAMLHVVIDARANVWPLVPPNHSNATMLDEAEAPHAIPA
ncbi:MAG: acetolactate synthase 2 catalytic subunit [Xanthomonadales bacterium]|nr:acetolactate synthase 2 catalytic subunit [Xanthomonadales bacterium]